MTKKVVFAGCSYTAGNGLYDSSNGVYPPAKTHPNLWVNLCHNNIKRIANNELLNIGQTGASNTEIFENVVSVLAQYQNQIDTIFCQWTAMPRYNFKVNLELWDAIEAIDSGSFRLYDVKLPDGTIWTRKYINDLLDRLKVMHHLHWEILKVVKYTNTICNLASAMGIKNVFYINGICPWDRNYFKQLHNVTPNTYTEFTKTTILNIDNRNDSDIHKLYQQIHMQYKQAGGINESQWINLYDSFFNQITDTNFDHVHPGTNSNQLFYQTITNRLHNLNFH
jgi:hypothetical protein